MPNDAGLGALLVILMAFAPMILFWILFGGGKWPRE